MSEQYYAFGGDSYDNCPCPALAALGNVSGSVLEIAEKYDDIMRDQEWGDEGVVPESVAKDGWLTAIEQVRSFRDSAITKHEHKHYQEVVDEGEMVAHELGWL